jgi:hypothetical protein
MLSINVVMVLVTLISPAHADEQNATVQTDTAPIENPPLPRPKPSLLDATGDNPAEMISAFRHQHGEDSVVINAALTRALRNSKCLRVPRHARIAGGKVKGMGIAFNGARPLFPMVEHRAVIMPNPPRLRASHGGGKRRAVIRKNPNREACWG